MLVAQCKPFYTSNLLEGCTNERTINNPNFYTLMLLISKQTKLDMAGSNSTTFSSISQVTNSKNISRECSINIL